MGQAGNPNRPDSENSQDEDSDKNFDHEADKQLQQKMISNLNRFVYSSGEEDTGNFFDEYDETFDEEEPTYIPSKAMSKYASNPVQDGKRLTKK